VDQPKFGAGAGDLFNTSTSIGFSRIMTTASFGTSRIRTGEAYNVGALPSLNDGVDHPLTFAHSKVEISNLNLASMSTGTVTTNTNYYTNAHTFSVNVPAFTQSQPNYANLESDVVSRYNDGYNIAPYSVSITSASGTAVAPAQAHDSSYFSASCKSRVARSGIVTTIGTKTWETSNDIMWAPTLTQVDSTRWRYQLDADITYGTDLTSAIVNLYADYSSQFTSIIYVYVKIYSGSTQIVMKEWWSGNGGGTNGNQIGSSLPALDSQPAYLRFSGVSTFNKIKITLDTTTNINQPSLRIGASNDGGNVGEKSVLSFLFRASDIPLASIIAESDGKKYLNLVFHQFWVSYSSTMTTFTITKNAQYFWGRMFQDVSGYRPADSFESYYLKFEYTGGDLTFEIASYCFSSFGYYDFERSPFWYADLVNLVARTVNPIVAVDIDGFQHIENSIPYTTNDLVLSLLSNTLAITGTTWGDSTSYTTFTMKFTKDLNTLTNYNPTTDDISVSSHTVSMVVDYVDGISILTSSLQNRIASTVYVVPSSVGLKVNGEEMFDTSLQSAYTYLYAYSSTYTFSSASPSPLYFDVNIVENYSFVFAFDLVSSTYLNREFEVSTAKEITLSSVQYSFSSRLYYNGINGVDYGNKRVLSPNILLTDSQMLSFVLILQDGVSLPLTPTTAYIESPNQLVTSNDPVAYSRYYESDQQFSSWYIACEYAETNVKCFNLATSTEILLIYDAGNDIYKFTKTIGANNDFRFDFYIQPQYSITLDVLTQTTISTEIDVLFYSDIPVSNVDLVFEVPKYYKNWRTVDGHGIAISSDNYITISDISTATTTQILKIYGEYSDPITVSLNNYQNEPDFVFEDSFADLQIEYRADLQFSSSAYIFDLPLGADWTDCMVHYNDQSYKVDPTGRFTTEGWDESVTTAYLEFTAKPITAYSVAITDTQVSLNVDANLPMSLVYLVFKLPSSSSKAFADEKVLKVQELNGYEYYYVVVSLAQGSNAFSYAFKEYTGAEWWMYLMLFAVLGLGIYLYSRYRDKLTKKGGSKKDATTNSTKNGTNNLATTPSDSSSITTMKKGGFRSWLKI
jgi:hypothetical protein